MTCPGCGTAMVPESFLDVPVHVCPSCAGLWFGPGGLGRLVQKVRAGLAEIDATAAPAGPPAIPGDRACPACAARLHSYRYAGSSPVVLDGCPACGGVFVEDGELAAIGQRFVRQAGAPAGPNEQARIVLAGLESAIQGIRAKAKQARAETPWYAQDMPWVTRLF